MQSRLETAKRYAPYVYFLREEGNSWDWISRELGISLSTCQRYIAIHKATMENEPTLSQALESAKSKLPSLLNDSVKQYKTLLSREYGSDRESAPMQKIAFDAATNILRSGNVKVLTDPKTVVVHELGKVTNVELDSEIDQLLIEAPESRETREIESVTLGEETPD